MITDTKITLGCVTLWCEFGEGHEWTRERQRGRVPRFCPEHRAVPTAKPKVTTERRTETAIAAALADGAPCRCNLRVDMTAAEIYALGAGCCDPAYVCGTLDKLRRKLARSQAGETV